MLGIIICEDKNILLSQLDFWYKKLKDICIKIFIISNNINNILNNNNLIIVKDRNFITNEEYDFSIVVNANIIIDNFNLDDNINYNTIIYWNNIPGIWIFKKEIEQIFINDDYENNKNLFLKKNIQTIIWNKDNINYLTIPNKIHINGTLIIVALYIGNIDIEKINISLNCLKNLRKCYPEEIIVIVDNNSSNKDWISLAKSLNMYIIKNTSKLFRYEVGAYNLALKYFSADTYICIQHTIQFHSKLNLELNMNKPDAYLFKTLTHINWTYDGLLLINKYLNFINMANISFEPLAIWCCFCCNNLMMNKILDSGLFDLICDKKILSETYERLIGVFLYRELKYVKVIDSNFFTKHFLNQA